MTTLVSMIRGINVGGRRPIRMERLRTVYEALGFMRVATYLQSGNVVFAARQSDAAAVARAIERRICGECGIEVSVAIRTSEGMTAAVARNPFLPRPSLDPRLLHATFLIPCGLGASLEGISLPLAPGEEAALVGDTVYLYCPHGYGVTRLNNGFFERKLGARATTRNWNAVTALERMAREAARTP